MAGRRRRAPVRLAEALRGWATSGGAQGTVAAAAAPIPLPPAPIAARPVAPPPVARAFSARDRRVFGYLLLAVCSAIAAMGQLGSLRPLLILGSAGAALLVIALAPEFVLALFLLAGAIKAAPWMPALPIDLTLLSWAAMVIAMVRAAARPGGIPKIPRTALLGLALVVIVVASVWWSLDPAAGFGKAVKFELLTMSGFVAPMLLIRSRAAMIRLMVALTGSGMLIALTTVSTTNAGEPLAAAGGNEITAGLYPAIGLIAALGFLALLPRGWRVVGFLPALVLLPAVVAAGSRGVLVAGAAALAYVTVRHIFCSRRPALTAIVVAVSLLVVAQLATTLAGGAAAKYESSLLSTNSQQVLGDRQFLYRRGIGLALNHPIAGVGVAGFATSSIIYETQLYPHNIVLELASEEGYTAVLVLALLIGAAWWARRRAPGGLRSPEAVVTGGLIILGVGESCFSFDINGNRLLWVAFGLAFALPHLRRGGSATSEGAR
jgi:O-antigen ligase